MLARWLLAVLLSVLGGSAQAQDVLGGSQFGVEVRPPPGWTVISSPAPPKLGEVRRRVGSADISVAFAVNSTAERQPDDLLRLFRGVFENQGYQAGPMRSETVGDRKIIVAFVRHPTFASMGGVYVFPGQTNHLVATVLYAPNQESAAKPLIKELFEGVRY